MHANSLTYEDCEELLRDANQCPFEEFVAHPETYCNRFGFYICLLALDSNVWRQSPEITDFTREIMHDKQIVRRKKWNPDGFFGKQWDHLREGEDAFLDSRWPILLEQDGAVPYSYRVRPAYMPFVERFFVPD